MNPALAVALALLMFSTSTFAHHGVASLGAAALDAPGAPVETSSSATLPAGRWLAFLKIDHAESKTGLVAPPESDSNQYWMLGLGYGFKPWLSGYVLQPYNIKKDTAGGLDSRGWADASLVGVLGFKYDQGFLLAPGNESLDDLMDWHFTLYGGASLPSGDANHRLADGTIDPGKSLGFGKASFTLGATASRQFSDKATATFEVGRMRFQNHDYAADADFPAGGRRMQFGAESRVNAALSYRLLTVPERRFRLDGNLEANYLALGRDISQAGAEPASGGKMLYAVAGVRLYQDKLSLGLALKKPVWTRLNEESQQQGSEGKEKFRLIATFSALF